MEKAEHSSEVLPNNDNTEKTADSSTTAGDTQTGDDREDLSPILIVDNGLHRTATTTSTSSRASRRFEQINPGDRDELVRLAKEYSRDQLNAGVVSKEPSGLDLQDPRLNPQSTDFDFYYFCQMLMRQLDVENIKHSRAGFTFKNLNVSGSGSAVKIQRTVADLLFLPVRLEEHFNFRKKPSKKILQNFDGVVKNGEMLMVLGRPGSGCSTFLKVISGELEGYHVSKDTVIHYNGIPQETMIKHFKGEVIYNQEVDKHFPHLFVGETLEFAAAVRTPHNRILGLPREKMIKYMSAVALALFGLTHTKYTKVGDDFIRGVSGGERKRVSIAEMALARSPIACWDNSTRGLDSATAHQFIQALRTLTDVGGTCQAVSAYQASQAMYDLFDKVIVLYEGREIYFGPTEIAKRYFETMGWICPERQTTGDFLTSVTNPQERRAKEGVHVPTTPEEFEIYWKKSPEFAALQQEITEHEGNYPIGGPALQEFKEMHKAQQSKHISSSSPYTISVFMQIKYCMKRSYQRIWNDRASTLTHVIGQISMSLIIGSIFYGTPDSTDAFFSKAAVIFFSVLLNALMAVTEINSLFAQRAIVEKHRSYAFYHPFTEAMAGYISDIPIKLLIATCFNIILYFLAGLRYEAGPFFIFFLFNFMAMLTMSGLFRAIAAGAKTISQAHAIAGVGVLALVIYTGFTIPRPNMHPWFKWISWINPIAYVFEAVLINELHGKKYTCAPTSLVPAYPGLSGKEFTCAVAGSVAGQTFVSGDDYAWASYQYTYSHVWRNFGFIIAFMIFFLFLFLLITELNSSTTSTAEVLVFRRGHVPKYLLNANSPKKAKDVEAGMSRVSTVTTREVVFGAEQDEEINIIPPQKDIFTWQNVNYDIPIKEGTRRLLDDVSGWVKPGTLTTLMGVSGAGKTTLLNVLAQRVPIGVVHGDMLVNGNPLPASFQRSTGYVQQQDLHLETSTVREALRFSALLRQPKSVSKKEKYEYVEHVIDMLNMQEFSQAVVGVPGEGLNVEQRKLLTIGVELAAKPALLLFLDEPTSGLDSQSSWSIVSFLRKLADNGQAVLTTIHQPSAMLFSTFDRLLFLAQGGKTVYFGDIGQNAQTLFKYFEINGARPCGPTENPAEYILEIAGETKRNWPDIWKNSQEAKDVLKEIEHIKVTTKHIQSGAIGGNQEFAMPFTSQLWHCTRRVFQQYWRTPSYIFGKFMLGIASSLFIGFSFWQSNTSLQGMQNVILSIFMLTAIFGSLVQQIMPRFITQRSLYEVRERPSKAYSWAAFLISNIIVEIPYQLVLAVCVFGAYNYPIFGIQSSQRQGLLLLFIIEFFLFGSTFAHLVIAALPDADTAGSIATLMFALIITFNGVMQPPSALPGFWIFLYRVSPFTYLVSGIISSALHGRPIECSAAETAVFQPPQGLTCGAYMQRYLAEAPGYLIDMAATSNCEYCPESLADQYLAGRRIEWGTRWRNVGLMWAYITFNIFGAAVMYYVFRVRRWSLKGFKEDVVDGVKWFGKIAKGGFGQFGIKHHSGKHT